MKKIDFKLFSFSALIIFIFFLVFSIVFIPAINIFAQEETIEVQTTSYSILGPNSYIFSGIYLGNIENKAFTTYFEFKKDSTDFSADVEETIKIVRGDGAPEYADFYTSPELNLFSLYYFRAVGYYNDNPGQKYYGNMLNLTTGYIPPGATIPYTILSGQSNPSPLTFIYDNISESNVSENSANFKTSIISSQNPEQLQLKVEYGTDNFTFQGNTLQIDNQGQSEIVFVGLQPDLTYKYRIFDTTGVLSPGTTHIFKTTIQNPEPLPLVEPGDNGSDGGNGLVPCTGTDECGFYDIFTLINTVVKFIFIDLILPLAAIMFAYAGFELLTSGGETSKREKAKKIFTNVAIGLIITAAAFLIVQTILSIVGYDKSWNWFGF